MAKIASSLIRRNSASRRCDLLNDNYDDTPDNFAFSLHGCIDAPVLLSAGSVKSFTYGDTYAVQTIIRRDQD